mmetsp:Transcript_601/g.339  ORF Transcript_601/g.339 Transcript_601/m.339 type:complete len:87 (-) Transcript_601:153-413(-)
MDRYWSRLAGMHGSISGRRSRGELLRLLRLQSTSGILGGSGAYWITARPNTVMPLRSEGVRSHFGSSGRHQVSNILGNGVHGPVLV